MSSYWNDPFCNKLVLFKIGYGNPCPTSLPYNILEGINRILSYSEGILKQVVKGNVTEYLFSQRISHWHSQTENYVLKRLRMTAWKWNVFYFVIVFCSACLIFSALSESLAIGSCLYSFTMDPPTENQ